MKMKIDFFILRNKDFLNLLISALLARIINIAKGDYLVSKWSYEFHEKKPGGFYDKNKYIDRILTWIFN